MSLVWYDLAKAEKGVTEFAKGSNPIIVDYFKDAGVPEIKDDSVPWCAAFMGAMLQRAGHRGTGSLLARSYLDWGVKVDRPFEGCVIILKRGTKSWQGHVAFFVRFEGNHVVCLGGNQTNMVRESRYPKKDIIGYRSPKLGVPGSSATNVYPVVRLTRGMMNNSMVRVVQERLNVHGAKPMLLVDGDFGPMTDAAVRQFQRENALSVDGIVYTSLSSETWPALLSAPDDDKKQFPDVVINRKKFFDEVRDTIFGGSITQNAVETISMILDEWEAQKLTDLRHLGYMFGTCQGEVGVNFKCVRETFAETDKEARRKVQHRKYGKPDPVTGEVYYGRCLVQLTWPDNYKRMGKLLGIPLYEKPDLALELKNAVKIMFEGMLDARSGVGDFTNKSLNDYFSANKEDWYNARRIINGTDRAAEIARYGRTFYAALLNSVEPRKTIKRYVKNFVGGIGSTKPAQVVGGTAGGVGALSVVAQSDMPEWGMGLTAFAAASLVFMLVRWTTK